MACKIPWRKTSRIEKGNTRMQNEFDSADESEWDEEEPYYDWDDPDWREDWDEVVVKGTNQWVKNLTRRGQ